MRESSSPSGVEEVADLSNHGQTRLRDGGMVAYGVLLRTTTGGHQGHRPMGVFCKARCSTSSGPNLQAMRDKRSQEKSSRLHGEVGDPYLG